MIQIILTHNNIFQLLHNNRTVIKSSYSLHTEFLHEKCHSRQNEWKHKNFSKYIIHLTNQKCIKY